MSAQGNALGNDVSLEFEALKGRDRSKGFLIVPQSLSKIYVHLIFGTKNRQATLPQSIREELHAYIGGILNHWESPPVTIASVSDHVHIVFMLSRNHPIRRIVEEVKKSSSKWLKGKAGIAASFQWQNGYGAFSVSQSRLDSVTKYVTNQETHHASESFQDEFRRFLKAYGVQFDERYVWD